MMEKWLTRFWPPWRERRPVVAVLRLSGVIGGESRLSGGLNLTGLAGQIERAFKLHHLKAVALAVNSPGGSPVQSALIARRIRALADEKKVPVFAFAEDVAASGGYWLACAGDEIYADENSIIGSIGVIYAGFGFQALLEKIGIERRLHTRGDKKMMLDPFATEDAEDVTRLMALQKDVHDSFKAYVRERRGERLKGAQRKLFSGEVWTGKRALGLGLIDGLGDLRTVMRARYGDKVWLRVVAGAARLAREAAAAAAQYVVGGLGGAVDRGDRDARALASLRALKTDRAA